jgi:hypothetical protein
LIAFTVIPRFRQLGGKLLDGMLRAHNQAIPGAMMTGFSVARDERPTIIIQPNPRFTGRCSFRTGSERPCPHRRQSHP